MDKKTQQFILKARKIHLNKYNYTDAIYVNAVTKICIICPIHGNFLMRPNNHLNGQGCKQCGISIRPQNKPKSSERFIIDSKSIHHNNYDYSKVHYVDNSTKVEITCPVHGSFLMRPYAHLQGQGCPKCRKCHHKSVIKYPYQTKLCHACKLEKSVSEYYVDNGYYRGNCKDCEKKIKVEYRKDPANKSRLRTYHKQYRNSRRIIDPVYRLRVDIPTIIRRSIKKKYYKDSIWNYLPYTPIQLKEHLEKQFEASMTWDNHGDYWHIDHIIPQAAFQYDSENHPDFIKCWALNNLRPLKATDNMHKSSIHNGKRIFKRYLYS